MRDDEETPIEEQSTASCGFPYGALDQVGPYKILQELGEGGMGVVYLAQQEQPIRRRVALKLIKWGMDTKAVVARFEAERQALALMSHPNVARVFDAGATEQGRPYFAMEYVKGEPITKYCDRNRLTMPERLNLFIQVCEGVQHAHQKGIIHRDIKPSNVLVEIQGDKPMPKIIDFGIAKATEHRLTDKTVFTHMGVLIGTPEYMSPEQAEMTNQDIDTRTDVYSLGVILYELLVGTLPLDPRELRRAGFDEIRRRIREEEPLKPSTRVSTLGDDSMESARRRRTVPRSLSRELRGDLDWITMKALEKNRTRRYESPSALADDLERHLARKPVLAGPPSVVYRASRFVRRHRLALTGGVGSLVLVMAFAVVAAAQARGLAAERQRAFQEAERVSSVLESLDRDLDLNRRIEFGSDLDQIAPLGKGLQNAATWFADFARPRGARVDELRAAVDRAAAVADHRRLGGIPTLMPDDPLLLEAETWVNQQEMRFYPDIWEPQGLETQLPNLLMMLQLADSWVARGDASTDLSAAMQDYRRAIRLGRLLRKEDAALMTDLIGLRCIEAGLVGLQRRFRDEGDARLADRVRLALCDLGSQRLASSRLLQLIDIAPYARSTWFDTYLDVPEHRLEEVGAVATDNPNRRFRVEAAGMLCQIRWLGRGDQKRRARELLDEVGAEGDFLLASEAKCLVNPFERGLISLER